MKVLSFALAIATTIPGGGCASQGRTSGVARADPTRITAAEVAASTATTGLELVRRLRPQWLIRRGQGSFYSDEPILAYVNSHPAGVAASALAAIPIADIRSLEFLDGAAATQRFGTNHGGGVVLVRTR